MKQIQNMMEMTEYTMATFGWTPMINQMIEGMENLRKAAHRESFQDLYYGKLIEVLEDIKNDGHIEKRCNRIIMKEYEMRKKIINELKQKGMVK